MTRWSNEIETTVNLGYKIIYKRIKCFHVNSINNSDNGNTISTTTNTIITKINLNIM